MSNRFSVYSSASAGFPTGSPRPQQNMQVSTTTLLNALHSSYNTSQPYQLDAGASVVVNTWLNANQAATVDQELALRAWEHARRRAEDGCIVLWLDHTLLRMKIPAFADFYMIQLDPSVDAIRVRTFPVNASGCYPWDCLHNIGSSSPVPICSNFL